MEKWIKDRLVFKGVQGLVFIVGEWNPGELVRLIDVKSEVGFGRTVTIGMGGFGREYV